MHSENLKAHHHPVKIMGCGFVITAIDDNPQRAWNGIRAAEKEMRRIEDLISSWKEDSQTTAINIAAGKTAVQVSEELFSLIERSLKVSQLTSGGFDISGTLSRYVWNFNNQSNTAPDASVINALKTKIDYRKIILNPDDLSVFLSEKGMKIGFGGIGKGYAANRAVKVMRDMGIQSGLINASGDLMCWGNPPNRDSWEIKIPDPEDRVNVIMSIHIPEGSIVSSGSSENYTLIEGKRYSHIVNPKTGWPVSHIKGVSVICPDAELGDALATALSVLEVEEGLNVINQLNGIECVITDEFNKHHFSKNLKPNAYA